MIKKALGLGLVLVSSGIFLFAQTAAGANCRNSTATFYANHFEGRTTANGERFTQSGLTASHDSYRMGTRVRVTNSRTGASVVVRVNDRGAGAGNIDLSRAAFGQIGTFSQGRIGVCVQPL